MVWWHGLTQEEQNDRTEHWPTLHNMARDILLAGTSICVFSHPVDHPDTWVLPDQYGLREAHAILLSKGCSSGTGQLTFPTIESLLGTDYDTLMFSDIWPNYPKHHYMADGTRHTKQQCKDYEEGESLDMVNVEGSANNKGISLPIPSNKTIEAIEGVHSVSAPALQSFKLIR